MKSEIAHEGAAADPGAAPPRPPQPPHPPRQLTVQLSSTRRGARLARRLAAEQLDAWGWPYDSDTSRNVALLVAELAANAALHGRLAGRDFRLRVAIEAAEENNRVATLRIEVTDTRPDRRPPTPGSLEPPPPGAESGHGLLLVEALADRWGVSDGDPLTKTVWCELDLTPISAFGRLSEGSPAGDSRHWHDGRGLRGHNR